MTETIIARDAPWHWLLTASVLTICQIQIFHQPLNSPKKSADRFTVGSPPLG